MWELQSGLATLQILLYCNQHKVPIPHSVRCKEHKNQHPYNVENFLSGKMANPNSHRYMPLKPMSHYNLYITIKLYLHLDQASKSRFYNYTWLNL